MLSFTEWASGRRCAGYGALDAPRLQPHPKPASHGRRVRLPPRPDPERHEFARRLQTLINESLPANAKSLTHTALAAAISTPDEPVHRETIRDLLDGNGRPTLSITRRLARHFDVPIGYFTGDDPLDTLIADLLRPGRDSRHRRLRKLLRIAAQMSGDDLTQLLETAIAKGPSRPLLVIHDEALPIPQPL